MKMHNIKIRKIGHTTIVIADTTRFGEQQIMFEGLNKSECIDYIKREGCEYADPERTDDTEQSVFEKIYQTAPGVVLDVEIEYVEKLPYATRAAGMYDFKKIYICEKYRNTPVIKDIIMHEMGHYIHDKYFKNKQFRFPAGYKTAYAGRDKYENFACTFTDTLSDYKGRSTGARADKMRSILRSI